MPATSKTKKKQKKSKKIKPALRQAKKKAIKRTTTKKVAKIFNIKKTISLPAVSEINDTKPAISFPEPVTKEIEQINNYIKKQNTRLSPHVLDLKKFQTEKEINKLKEDQDAQIITTEIYNKLSEKTYSLKQGLKNLYQNAIANLQELKPKIKIKAPKITEPKAIKAKHKIKLPKINWPTFDWHLPKLPRIEVHFFNLVIPHNWAKSIISFIFLCLILALPFNLYNYYQGLKGKKNDVLQQASQALLHLTLSQKAASAQDLYYTQLELQEASNNFNQAQKELDNVNIIVKGILKLLPEFNKQYVTATKLIEIGEKLSQSAVTLTQTYDKLNLDESIQALNLTDKLSVLKNGLNLILPDLKDVNAALQDVYIEEIPDQYKADFQKLQFSIPLLEKNISMIVSSADLISDMLGKDSKKRYLILFQNNNELRPTGGFIGSYALLDIDKGNIEKITIPGGGPYDLKAGLKVSIESPEPLHIMNARWEFQDANWFADLPLSAEKIMYFYEKSGGPTVDGLIFINATFFEKLLEKIGPIELPEYNKVITSQNFFEEIQKSVELDYDKTQNKPKQIIADLTPKIIDRLLQSDKKQFTEILNLFLASLNEKELQLFFNNFSLEKSILNNNWGGQLKETDLDYLNIVSTNIAGEKTDAKIEQTAKLEVNIQKDGSIINTLSITKTHLGNEGEKFYGVPNLDYIRIFTPKGSELLSATGFEKMPSELFTLLDPEIYQKDPDIAYLEMSRKIDQETQTETFTESNKTVFANWIKVEPGQTKTVTLRYKLPFNLNLAKINPEYNYLDLIKQKLNLINDDDSLQKYSLLIQKQSGKRNFKLSIKIIFPEIFNYQIIYPNDLNRVNNIFNFANALNSDKLLAIIFQR